MWGLMKMLGTAAVVGAGVGAYVKSKVDTVMTGGEKPKKIKKSKLQLVEIPADAEVEEVKVFLKKNKTEEED